MATFQHFINLFSTYENDLQKIIRHLEDGHPDMARFTAREMLNSVVKMLKAAKAREIELEKQKGG